MASYFPRWDGKNLIQTVFPCRAFWISPVFFLGHTQDVYFNALVSKSHFSMGFHFNFTCCFNVLSQKLWSRNYVCFWNAFAAEPHRANFSLVYIWDNLDVKTSKQCQTPHHVKISLSGKFYFEFSPVSLISGLQMHVMGPHKSELGKYLLPMHEKVGGEKCA